MLTRLVVKNFKSIGEKGIDLELKPLTLLVGRNGGGKSSILEALALLSANVGESAFRLVGELVRFSAYEEIAHKHKLDRWLTWEIHLPRKFAIRYEHRPDSGEAKETVFKEGKELVQFSLQGNRQEGFSLACSMPGWLPEPSRGTSLVAFDSRKYNLEMLVKTLPHLEPVPFGTTPARPSLEERLEKLPANEKKQLLGLAKQLAEVRPAVDTIATALKERLFLLSSFRGRVSPEAPTGDFPRWVGVNGEGLITMLSLLHSSPLYESAWSRIQHWAEEFGLLRLKAGIRGANRLAAEFMDPDLKTIINLAFAGMGSRQIAPVIVHLFWAKPDSLIMIEEPEMSLHPEAQVKLGALFADAIKEDKQIIATTHSHFLLLALGQAVQSGLKVEDIAVYHVTKGEDGTKAAPVKLSKRGYPLGWPPSYEEVERKLAFDWAKGLAKQ